MEKQSFWKLLQLFMGKTKIGKERGNSYQKSEEVSE
jgi:hypothetical protein